MYLVAVIIFVASVLRYDRANGCASLRPSHLVRMAWCSAAIELKDIHAVTGVSLSEDVIELTHGS